MLKIMSLNLIFVEILENKPIIKRLQLLRIAGYFFHFQNLIGIW